jgi:hypothetical protein
MQKILTAFQDDTGATSMMRVVVFLAIIAVIASKFVNAWMTKTPIVWTADDLTILGGAATAKLVQNSQESAPVTPKTP